MEVASALLDASNNKGSKSPCDNNSSSSWLGGWLHPRFTLVYILSGLYQNISFFTKLFQEPSGAVQEAGWRPGVRRGARSEEVPAADLPGGRGGAGGGNQ